MSDPQETPQPASLKRGEIALILAALALFFVPAITSATQKAATFDEPVYIIAGLSYHVTGEYVMKEDAPPLVAKIAGLAPWISGLKIPGDRLPFRDSLGREYPYSVSRLYEFSHRADSILLASRLSLLIPFGLILLLSVYFWSRELFGRWGAMASLILAALSPNLLAHGRLVAADFPSAAMMTLSSYLFWRLLKEPRNRRRMIAFGVSLGFALITKYTMVLLIPSLGLVGLIALWKSPARDRAPLIKSSAFALAIAAIVPFFAYGLSPKPEIYLDGLQTIYRNISTKPYPWYLFGEFHSGGTWYYYLAVLAVKTSAPLLILGLGAWLWAPQSRRHLVDELSLVIPGVVLLLAASGDEISAGIRRVIAILPLLCVSAGRLAQVGLPGLSPKILRVAVALGLMWHASSSLQSWPHYLPYFNELAGGQEAGPDLLDDSAIDWGQDLTYLRDTMEENDIPFVRLCYFGIAPPAYYGIRYEETPPALLLRPRPGIYAISLHHLIRMQQHGLDWLTQRKPIAKAGTSIWFYVYP